MAEFCKFVFFYWFTFVVLTIEIHGLKTCDFSSICSGNVANHSGTRLKPGKVYHYDLSTDQHLTIGSGDELKDTQTLRLQVDFLVKRRSGLQACVIDLLITNLTVTYLEVGTNEETTESHTNPIHAAAISHNKGGISTEICLPIQEQWKSNLVRSLILEIDPDLTGSEISVNQELQTELYGCRYLTNTMNFSPLQSGLAGKANNSSPALDRNVNSFSPEIKFNNFPHYRLQCFGAEFSTNLSDPEERIVNIYDNVEEQIVAGSPQMLINATTATALTLISVDEEVTSIKFNLESQPELFMASLKWDQSPPGVSKEPKVIQDFHAALPQICKLSGDSFSTNRVAEFMEKIRKLVKVAPINELRVGEEVLLRRIACDEGLQLYYELLASSPSDDTVEFTVDLLLKGDGNFDVFRKFSKIALQLPSTEPFAGIRAVQAVTRLLEKRSILSWEIDDSTFLLSMVAFLYKIRNKGTVDVDFDSILEAAVDTLVTKLEPLIINGPIDFGTRLEASKMLDTFVMGRKQGTSNTCNRLGLNSYHLLKCLNPCDDQLGSFLEKNIGDADAEISVDIQAIVYIIMRKCPDFTVKWKPVLKNFLESNSTNEEVKKFIIHHSYTIKDKIIITAEDETSPESGKVGRTFIHEFKQFRHNDYSALINDYSTTRSVELNLIMGNDFIPRMVRLGFAYGGDSMYEIEFLRSPDATSTPEKFDIFVSNRKYNGFTVATKTVNLDIGKIKRILQDVGSTLNSKSIEQYRQKSIMKWIKSKIDVFIKKLLENRTICILHPFLFEDKLRQFSTMSGLPLKLGMQIHGALSFNYKWDVAWKEGEFVAVFEFHPSLSWKQTETTTIAFGHNDIIGYEVGTDHSAAFNFVVNFVTQDDQRTFLTKLSFSSPHGNDSLFKEGGDVFFKNDFKFLKLSRVQYLDSYTTMRKSDHVWNLEHSNVSNQFLQFNKTYSEKVIQLNEHWAVFGQGKCVDKTIEFRKPGPYYYSKETTCSSIPDINIMMKPDIKPGRATIEMKIFPSSPNPFNTYSGLLSIEPNRKEHSYVMAFELGIPGKQIKLQAKLTQSKEENSVQLLTALDGSEFGVKVFLKQKPFNNSSDQSRRRRETNSEPMNTEILSLTNPYSDKQYEFGVESWIGRSTAEPVMLLQSGLIFVDQQLFSTWMDINTLGLLPSLDSKLNITIATRRNTSETINLDGEIIPNMQGHATSININFANNLYGKFSVLGELYSSPLILPLVYDESLSNKNLEVYNGFIEIPYRLTQGASGTLLKVKYTTSTMIYGVLTLQPTNIEEYQRKDVKDGVEMEILKRLKFFGTLESSIFPSVDTTFHFVFSSKSVPSPYNMQSCPDCNVLNYTTALEVQLKRFPEHHLKVSGTDVHGHIAVQATLGRLAQVNFVGDRTCNESPCRQTLTAGVKCRETNTDLNWNHEEITHNAGGVTRTTIMNTLIGRQAGQGYTYKHTIIRNATNSGSQANTSYDGTFNKEPSGPRYRLTGDAYSELLIPKIDENYFVETAEVLYFQGLLNEESWDEPRAVYFHDKSARFLPRGKTIIKVNDTQNTYLDLQLQFDFTAEKEEEEQPLTAFLLVKDLVKVDLDGAATQLTTRVEILPVDFNLTANLLWSSNESIHSRTVFLRGSFISNSIENPTQRYFGLETENELKIFQASQSIHALSEYLHLSLGPHNTRLYSKSKLRIKSVSQKFTFAIQMFPEEEEATPVLLLEWVLPTADKFFIQVEKQFKVALICNAALDELNSKPCLLTVHRMTMERPGYAPFVSNMKIKAFNEMMSNIKDGKPHEHSSFDITLYHKIRHHEFFVPFLDAEVTLRGNLKGTMDKDGIETLGIVEYSNKSYTNYRTERQLDISLTAAGRQKLPETKLVLEYIITDKLDAFEQNVTLRASLKNIKLHKTTHLSINSSGVTLSSAPRLSENVNGMDYFLRTVFDNDKLIIRRNCLGYGFTSKGYDATVFGLEGHHHFSRFFDTWTNFEVSGTHIIECPFISITWEDKIYSNLTSSFGIIEAQSSNLFNITLELDREQGSTTFNFSIVPSFARTAFSSKAVRFVAPSEPLLQWRIVCDSVLFQKRLEIEAHYTCSKQSNSSPGSKYVTHLVYTIPLRVSNDKSGSYSGQLDSIVQQYFLELEGNITAEVVAHALKFERYQAALPIFSLLYASTTAILKRDNQPVFFHRDFFSNYNRYGVNLATLNGSLSISSPSLFATQPLIAQVKFNYELGNQKTSGDLEGFLRLGLVERDNAFGSSCHRSNLTTFLSSEIQSKKPEIVLLRPETLQNLFHQKLHLEHCCDRNESLLPCADTYGTFYAKRQHHNFELVNGTIAPHVSLFEARWTKDRCLASHSTLNRTLTLKNLNNRCTAVLKAIKDRYPCWYGELNRKSDKSAKSYPIAVWNNVVGAMKPLHVTILTDSVLIGTNMLINWDEILY